VDSFRVVGLLAYASQRKSRDTHISYRRVRQARRLRFAFSAMREIQRCASRSPQPFQLSCYYYLNTHACGWAQLCLSAAAACVGRAVGRVVYLDVCNSFRCARRRIPIEFSRILLKPLLDFKDPY
jgi:hypothetical protein